MSDELGHFRIGRLSPSAVNSARALSKLLPANRSQSTGSFLPTEPRH
jgi:hypothetical protein